MRNGPLFGQGSGRVRRGWLGLVTVAVVAALTVVVQPTPAQAAPVVARVWGETAVGTAAELSKDAFTSGASTVYVATVSGFWDALSGGPAAAQQDGPMLLTEPDSLPQETRDELARLRPSTIVIQGGELAVSAGVETALASYAGTVLRNAGDTAIGTSVLTSQRAFPNGAPSVFVATADSFYDALSGGAAAGRNGAPVLLVEPNGVDARVTAEIARLGAKTVYLLGGPLALPEAIETGLAGDGVTVQRLWGETALDTALAINRATIASARQVYLVTDQAYYDGLSAAAAADRAAGTVLLTNGQCLTPATKQYLASLDPSRVVVVGGTLAMDAAMDSLTECQQDITITSASGTWNSPTFALQPGNYAVSWEAPKECTVSVWLKDPMQVNSETPVRVVTPHEGSGSNILYRVLGDTYFASSVGRCDDDRGENFSWTITLRRVDMDGGASSTELSVTNPVNNLSWSSPSYRLQQGVYSYSWQAPSECSVIIILDKTVSGGGSWPVWLDAPHDGSGALSRYAIEDDVYNIQGMLTCEEPRPASAQWTFTLRKVR